MQHNILHTSLINSGFDDLTARIYLELLDNRSLTISDLAKRFSVQRGNIYNSLAKLQESDLISKSAKFARQIQVSPPTKIIPILQQKEYSLKSNLEGLNSLLPDLIKQYYDKKSDFVKVYNGKTQLRRLFDLVLVENQSKEILGLGDAQSSMELWGLEYELEWRRRRIKQGTSLRMLAYRDEVVSQALPKNQEELRQIKLLPSKFKSQGLIIIAGNQVSQWNPIVPRAILIEDTIFAAFFRSMFEVIWELV